MVASVGHTFNQFLEDLEDLCFFGPLDPLLDVRIWNMYQVDINWVYFYRIGFTFPVLYTKCAGVTLKHM